MFTYEFTNNMGTKTKRSVNLIMWNTLRGCAGETVNLIEDDSGFCVAEYDLFREWYREKGFTKADADYVEACGYDWSYEED